jgi:hypothetical protein
MNFCKLQKKKFYDIEHRCRPNKTLFLSIDAEENKLECFCFVFFQVTQVFERKVVAYQSGAPYSASL